MRAVLILALLIFTGASLSCRAKSIIAELSDDVTPGYSCELNMVPASEVYPVGDFTVDCTIAITEDKALELVGLAMSDAFKKGHLLLLYDYSILRTTPPTASDNGSCPTKSVWGFMIAPPNFSVEL